MKLIAKATLIFAVIQLVALVMGANFASANISIVQNPADVSNSIYFFATVIIMAVVLLAVLKFYKGKLLFLLLEILMEFSAVQIFLSLFTNDGVSFAVAIIAVAARLKFDWFKQPLLLFTTAVVGGLIGASLNLLPALVLALLLAGYDIVAVFYTKHMVTLAKGLGDRSTAFTMKVREGKHKLELGTGDIVIPAMLASAANSTGKQILVGNLIFTLPGIAAAAFSIIGMYVMLTYIMKHRGYWPALPPLVVSSAIGIGLAMLIA